MKQTNLRVTPAVAERVRRVAALLTVREGRRVTILEILDGWAQHALEELEPPTKD